MTGSTFEEMQWMLESIQQVGRMSREELREVIIALRLVDDMEGKAKEFSEKLSPDFIEFVKKLRDFSVSRLWQSLDG